MRNHAHFQAAGALAERRAADIRKKLRTEPHTHAERDDAELMATIHEAAAYDLLARGPRPANPNPVTTLAKPKVRRKTAVAPPVDQWRDELAHIQSRQRDRGSVCRQNVLERALAAVEEREAVITRLLKDDVRLEELNRIIGRVADLSDRVGAA